VKLKKHENFGEFGYRRENLASHRTLVVPAHNEALDLLAEVAEGGCVTLPFETGDLVCSW
jgi:hypothetical protein